MITYQRQNIPAPNTPPSTDAGGKVTRTNDPEPTTTPSSPSSSDAPSHTDTSDPPRWQMVEYRHKGCGRCHAFIAFNSLSTTDMNSLYEKVVELAVNTICVFHEGSPRVQGVDVSRRFEKGTSRLVVEVTTSAAS